MLQRYATTDEPVLITGEIGTGKELADRAIHENSRRHAGLFIAMTVPRFRPTSSPRNCSAINDHRQFAGDCRGRPHRSGWPFTRAGNGVGATRPQPASETEPTALLNALTHTQENVSLTAEQLGVSRVTLYRMLHRHAIVLNCVLKSAPGAGRQAVQRGVVHAN